MKKYVLPAIFVVTGLSILSGCIKKKKEEPVAQEQKATDGKELADLCEHKKWCGCDKE